MRLLTADIEHSSDGSIRAYEAASKRLPRSGRTAAAPAHFYQNGVHPHSCKCPESMDRVYLNSGIESVDECFLLTEPDNAPLCCNDGGASPIVYAQLAKDMLHVALDCFFAD